MEHSNPSNLPTLSSTSPITTSPSETTTTPTTTSPSHSPLSLHHHHHHHHRRRYLSNASSSSSTATSVRDAASLSAKRELAQKVREDWSFPWPPSPSSTITNGHHNAVHELPISEVQEWRLREVDSSSPSQSPSPSPGPGPTTSSANMRSTSSEIPDPDPYKFDSPDAIGTTFAELAAQRRWRRRKQLEEEMAANEGLRCWVARRDAWSGGRTKPRPRRRSSQQQLHPKYLDGTTDAHTTMTTQSPVVNEQSQESIATPSLSPSTSYETLLPLVPPLLPPTNPIRASITPSTYPSIYSKVVLQGLSPTVPINLSDMTRALVQGWKEDDQWPPRASAPEPTFSSRRNRGAARTEGNGLGSVGERHPHLNRGVGAVKKVLGLDGRGSGGSSGQSKEGGGG